MAHAKINLYLDILGKQSNGYHSIWSITQSIGLADEIRLTRNSETNSEIKVVSNLSIPAEENLVKRTAELLRKEGGVREGATIHLQKSIPLAAGLGGGSADAAATLIGLNKIWDLGLPRSLLEKFAPRIGLDVPLCLQGGTLLAEGKGEKLTILPSLPLVYIVIAKPPFEILTKEAYALFDREKISSFSSPSKILNSIKKQDLKEIGRNLANIFEKLVLEKFPKIEELKKAALEAGAMGTLMSGSGPSVFALADSKPKAEKVFRALKNLCPQVILTTSYPWGVTEVDGEEKLKQ